MNCPQCLADAIPDDAAFCPTCGRELRALNKPVARVIVSQDVGQTGQVTGLQVGTVEGSVTVERMHQTVTALIEGEAIARLFERDRTRESLRELAHQIDDSVTRFLMAIQFAEVGAPNFSQQEYDQAYIEWEIKSEAIGTALRAHRITADIVTDWEAFATIVSEVYALSGTYIPSIRLPRLQKIQAALPDAGADWGGLEDIQARRGRGKSWERYATAWWSMRQALMGYKDRLVGAILDSPVP